MSDLDLKELTISQTIGQLVMPRLDFRDSYTLPRARELVGKFHVGGFIVFGTERKQITEATEELQSISQIPLFFACDAERGVGQIVSGATRFPFTMALGAIGDEDIVYRQAKFIAREMKECGLNLVFAPVVDVNTNPENPIINIRSYGDDPLLVSRLGRAFVQGSQDEGVLACAKHFPGHGAVAIDSHITLPRSVQSREEFWSCDLIPFRGAIESGVASIMVAHLAAPRIDFTEVPATISPEIIQRLLVRELGFKGLIITDSFFMGAIAELGKEENIAPLSLLSGCDIVLDPKEPEGLVERLNAMIKRGQISASHLDRSVRKIIEAKHKWLYDKPHEDSLDVNHGKNLLDEIAHRSVCCLRGGKLRSNRASLYVLDVTQGEEENYEPFHRSLAEAGINCQKRFLTSNDAGKALAENERSEEAIICLVNTSVAAWKGHTNLPESFRGFLRRVSHLNSEKIIISFGSPYVVRGFEHFDTILCAFDSMDVCQQAVAGVLLGRLEAQGRLPVKL